MLRAAWNRFYCLLSFTNSSLAIVAGSGSNTCRRKGMLLARGCCPLSACGGLPRARCWGREVQAHARRSVCAQVLGETCVGCYMRTSENSTFPQRRSIGLLHMHRGWPGAIIVVQKE
jgi:hypothetical protein